MGVIKKKEFFLVGFQKSLSYTTGAA